MRAVRAPSRPRDTVKFVIDILDLFDPVLQRFVFVPPIRMRINPQEINFQYRKLISRYETRGGWVEDHWGDELDIIAVTATTGSFFTDLGLNIANRHESLSMINFQEILDLYRNNACVYNDDGAIISQGTIAITYDNYTFLGQFQNFNWEEDSGKPFNYTYDFSFESFRTIVRV